MSLSNTFRPQVEALEERVAWVEHPAEPLTASQAAGVVTSAAIVMVAVFSIFATLSMLIFEQFDQKGTVHGVLRAFIAQGVQLPIRSQAGINRGQLEWRPPCRETIRQLLLHPIYAGAYAYGLTANSPTENNDR